MDDTRDLLRFTTAGSVDDGKSTLIGRLLFDTKQIFQDQMEALERDSALRGEEGINLALLTDGLRSEREQGITIDVAYRYFSTPTRTFIIADTPGHEQYTRNMVTGASTADLAIILIDARNGVVTQSRRHGIIAALLRIPHIIVAVNKMDLVDWSEARYREICDEYRVFAEKLEIADIRFLPVSALLGDNVVEPSASMAWYRGEPLLRMLETVIVSSDRNLIDFRLPVQNVIRPNQDFRGCAGTVTSGALRAGEEVLVLPGRRASRVRAIVRHGAEVEVAEAGQSVVVTLEDEIDVGRGDMIVRPHNQPEVASEFDAIVAWMDDTAALTEGATYIVQHTTRRVRGEVSRILYRLDVNTLHRSDATSLTLNQIGRVAFSTTEPIFYDPYDRNRQTGGFILIDPHDFRTVGAGMIRHSSSATRESLRAEDRRARVAGDAASRAITWDPGFVGTEDRVRRIGHRPLVVWFTGVSGAGKSTLATHLEKRLFDDGCDVVRLDGDNVRHGLSADLRFSAADRTENIRRIGHVARLFYDFGHVVLCTFVSPFREDRDRVRALIPEGDFVEVALHVSPQEAARRDPKGLYARAASGEITDLTGAGGAYEPPISPELTIDTTALPVDEAVARVLAYVAPRLDR